IHTFLRRSMKPWYLRTLPAQEALARANKNLESARNTQDQQRALKICKDAKSALDRINIPASIADINHIIAAYREHGRVLKNLGRDNEALVSYNKADELRPCRTRLTAYLQKLIKSADSYLAFQAAYASQALLWISNDEDIWKAVLRRAGTVTTGIAGLVSAAKALDVAKFFDGLGNIQEGLEGAGEFFGLVTDAFKGVADLMESGQGLQQSLKEGFSFSRKQKWYPVLRATDTLLRDGELIKFKSLVCDVPCRKDVAFQWGVSQRLGYVAADSHWDSDTRQGAIMCLGEIYRNDVAWGESVQVKQCILNILMQLVSESSFAVQ
ncbi:hypothetical protein BGZ99_000736, partial [Dissophora globulifera]